MWPQQVRPRRGDSHTPADATDHVGSCSQRRTTPVRQAPVSGTNMSLVSLNKGATQGSYIDGQRARYPVE